MLILRGAPALSAFRHGKLLEQLTQHVPAVTGLYAEFAHFADVTGALTADEEQVLARPSEWFWTHKRWPNDTYRRGR